jgi:uncharacterized protein YlxW (UPF0749 family)
VRDTADEGVLADGQVIRTPFVVEAIGDPHTLATALDISGGFVASVEDLGGKVSVEQLDAVDVTSLVEVPDSDYARPAPTG